MDKSKKVSIIIPCLNEEAGLKKILPQISPLVDEIIIVDNGSKDKSLEATKSLRDKRIKIIEEKKRGYGFALRRGLKEADGGYIIALDGDGSYFPSDTEKLVRKMVKNDLDFVWGTRFPLKNRKSMPFINLLGNKILTFFTNLLFGLNLKDSQSGMWAMKKDVLEQLSLTQGGMGFSEELKLEAIIKGLKYKEIIIGYQERMGKSELSIIKDGFWNLFFLFKKRFYLKEENDKKLFAKCFSVGLFSFIVLGAIGLQNKGLLDPDAFFHMRLSWEISKSGFSLNMPWFPFMPGFIDSNFLYHWISSLISSFDLIFVYKILGLFISSLIFGSFYFVLKKYKARFPLFWIILFFSSSAFVFRLLLFRPFLISVLLITLSFYFISKNKSLKFFVLSVLYPLFYVIPFSIFIALTYALIEFIKEKVIKLKFLGISSLGTVIGFLINPSFPKNLNFVFVQIFKTPIIHNAAELQPLDIVGFLKGNLLIWLVFCGILAVLIWYRGKLKEFAKRVSVEGLSAVFLSGFFFVLMVRSQRFIEYWVPFTVLAGALVSRDFELDKKFTNWIKRLWKAKKRKLALPISASILPLFLIFVNSLGENYLYLRNTTPYDRYKPAAEWLIKNTPEKSIVFNVSWDDFPELFFWDTRNYYIVGMDPTFMYEYDKDLYEKWRKVGVGEDENPGETVKKYFNSGIIFANKEKNPEFLKKAGTGPTLEKSYEDPWTIIYKIE